MSMGFEQNGSDIFRVRITFVLAHRCALCNVRFLASHRVVNVAIAPNAMMGE